MNKEPVTADTALADIRSLSAGPRQKLQQMGAETLGDIAAKLSRVQLKNARRIGPKTLALIEALLQQADLTLGDNRVVGSAELQVQVQRFGAETEQLRSQVKAWVSEHRPAVDLAWKEHQEGAYGDYLKAQMLALNEIGADPVVKREFEHQLVSSLHRYQRQTRYAKSKEALMDGITAQGRAKRFRRPR